MGMHIGYPPAESESGSVHPLVSSHAMKDFRTGSSVLSEFYMKLYSCKCRGSFFKKKSHPVRMDHKVAEIAQKWGFVGLTKNLIHLYEIFIFKYETTTLGCLMQRRRVRNFSQNFMHDVWPQRILGCISCVNNHQSHAETFHIVTSITFSTLSNFWKS